MNAEQRDIPDGTAVDLSAAGVRVLTWAKGVPDQLLTERNTRECHYYVAIPDTMTPREAVDALWDAAGTEHGRPE